MRLEDVYARVPKLQCKGLCGECCAFIAMSPAEERRIAAEGLPVPGRLQDPCPLLDFAGRCRAYELRPMVCRLWGVVESMPCPHGCHPDGGYLTVEEGFELLNDAMRVGGNPEAVEPEVLRARLKDPQLRRSARAIATRHLGGGRAR